MSIQELQRQLNQSEPKTRQKALSDLLNLGNHEAYGLLMFAASNHFSPDTRREAKKLSLVLQKRLFSQEDAAQATEFSKEVEEAFEAMKTAEPGEVRKYLQVLMQENNPSILQRFTRELHQIQRPEVLPYLLLGLGRLGKEEAIPYLANYLRSNNETIRASVIRALSDIASKKNLPILVRFSRDPSTLVRQEALTGLSHVEPESLVQTLKEVLSGKGDFHKEAVLYVIARLHFLPGLELVQSLFEEGDEVTKERARRVLEHLNKDSQKTPPTPQSNEETEKEEAAPKSEAQTEITPPPAETDLEIPTQEAQEGEETEEDPPDSELEHQEENALRVIRQGEESSAIKSIFTLIEISRLGRLGEVKDSVTQRGSKKVLATYLMAIAQSHDKSFQGYLLECLQHDDPRVQANAIEALRMIGCTEVKQQILPFINSRNDRTRGNAIVFLHSTGLIDTEQELTTMLESRSDNRKLSAIYSMTEIFDPYLIPLLEIPMDSPNPRVSKRAMDVLRMYVLEEHPKAVDIARRWNIYDEMTGDSVELSPEEGGSESETEDVEDEAKALENLADEIEHAGEKPPQPEETKAEETKEDASQGTIGKIKSFVGGLLKKKGKD